MNKIFLILGFLSLAMNNQRGDVGFGGTHASDFVFEPKVWSDHIQGYFDRMLVWGAFAVRNDQLKAEGSGETVTFPYYKTIGDAEELAETDVLTVDKLEDDSFHATVFEVGKAVGFTKKVFKKSSESQDKIMAEAQRQIARVHAEKADKKLADVVYTSGVNGFTATQATDTMNIRTLAKGKIIAFGDKSEQASVCFMHSLQYLDLLTDDKAGLLKADANSPFSMVKGYKGHLLDMAIVVTDSVAKVTDISGKSAYKAVITKENAYGLMRKQEMEMDMDKDILARQVIVTGNEWYAVCNFNQRVSQDDKKIAFLTTTAEHTLAV